MQRGAFGGFRVPPSGSSTSYQRGWSTKFEMRSPRYTTRIDELPVIAAA
ncbi:DUF4113 domain-containing protein [Methylobacterium fujisawaense]